MYYYIITLFIAIVVVFYIKKKFFSKKRPTKSRLDALVVSGPSGAGKGTLIDMLLKEFPEKFGFSVSHTTRLPREGEVDGLHYHFTSREKIQAMIARGEFLESCDVHGNIYGTSKTALAEVKRTGKVGIIEMDVQGAQKLKKQQGGLNFYYIFIKAPSVEELEKRIVARGKETDEKVKIRLETTHRELEWVDNNDTFFDRVLVNDDLQATYLRLKRIMKLYGGL